MIALMVIHNFIRKFANNDQEFQSFYECLQQMKVRIIGKRTMKNKV